MVIFVCQSIQFFISLRNQIIGTLGTCIWNTNMQLSLWIGYIFFIVNLFIGFYRLNVNYQLTSSMFNSAVKTTKTKAPRNLFSYEGKSCKHFWCWVNKCTCSFYLQTYFTKEQCFLNYRVSYWKLNYFLKRSNGSVVESMTHIPLNLDEFSKALTNMTNVKGKPYQVKVVTGTVVRSRMMFSFHMTTEIGYMHREKFQSSIKAAWIRMQPGKSFCLSTVLHLQSCWYLYFCCRAIEKNVCHHWDALYFVDTLKAGEISVRIYRNTRFVDILKRYLSNDFYKFTLKGYL